MSNITQLAAQIAKKPWLCLPASWAHDLSPYGLEIYSQLFGDLKTPVWNSYKYKNLIFKNRLGIAGGVDKNAEHLMAWQKVGCGFLEIGTVTPRQQNPNPGTILRRDLKTESVWNKMGFPSAGSDEAYYNLKKYKSESNLPVFVNIGKNRTTPNEDASSDYENLIEKFADIADAFVINISSPNTSGLRDLAKPAAFESFLKPITEKQQSLSSKPPLFLKISPDLENTDLKNILEVSLHHQLDGFILTNTTLDRTLTPFYPVDGGMSGKPLKEKSLHALYTAKNYLEQKNEKKCLISVGGVMTADDVFERIDKGADLVQVYSTLIFEGPGFFRKVAKIAKHRFSG